MHNSVARAAPTALASSSTSSPTSATIACDSAVTVRLATVMIATPY